MVGRSMNGELLLMRNRCGFLGIRNRSWQAQNGIDTILSYPDSVSSRSNIHFP